MRQHYRIWELTDYRRTGHIGSGVYALSADGRRRFGRWPQVIADDRFVQQLFLPAERRTLDEHAFTVRSARTIVRPPAPLDADRAGQPRAPRRAPARHRRIGWRRGRPSLLRRVAARPDLWMAFAVYSVTSTLPKVTARRLIAERREPLWARDDTTRVIA